MCLEKLAAAYIRYDTGRHDRVRIASQTPPAGVGAEEYAYLPDGDSMHILNFYRPEGADAGKKLPLIVNIHGGAWVYGDKDLNKYYCMYLASKGFCVTGMSYRLMPDVTLKEQVQDVFAALNWTADNAARLGADVSEVMLTGDSAGGHLASLALAAMLSPGLAERYGVKVPDMNVRCLVMSHPVCEVHSVLRGKDNGPARHGKLVQHVFDRLLFGPKPRGNAVYGASAFTEYSEGVTFPPVMLIGCERDVYARHSLFLADEFAKLEKEGRCPRFLFDFVKADDETRRLRHVYNIVRYEWAESCRVNDLSLAFFRESMGGADE